MTTKPRMKHRTVGPRKGYGVTPLNQTPRPTERRRTKMDMDTYEYFMKHGELPQTKETGSGFKLGDFLKGKKS